MTEWNKVRSPNGMMFGAQMEGCSMAKWNDIRWPNGKMFDDQIESSSMI